MLRTAEEWNEMSH